MKKRSVGRKEIERGGGKKRFCMYRGNRSTFESDGKCIDSLGRGRN